MTKRNKIFNGSIGTLMIFSSLNLGGISSLKALEEPVTNKIATPVIISEIVADTHQADMVTVNGTDAYEYFELYNTSNQEISLDDYLVEYVNGTTITPWQVPEGTILKAHESLIVWVRNSVSDKLSVNDFCNYYNLKEDKYQIVKTENIVGGFANSDLRELRISVKDTKQLLNYAIYNDEAKAQTKKGINFAYQTERLEQKNLGYDQEPTPGTLIIDQQLDGEYQFEKINDASVEIAVADCIMQGESLVVQANTNLPNVILSATLNVNGQEYLMAYEDGNYVVNIPAKVLENYHNLTVFVTMNDGINTIKSQEKEVSVVKDSVAFKAPLLISEINPNSANIDGSDAYEYLQIFNTSDNAVSLDDYQLVYVNGDKETVWQLDEKIILESKEILTVWIQNQAVVDNDLTIDDFNSNYQSSFVKGNNFTTIKSDGMSNSGTRSFKLVSKTGIVLNSVSYNAKDSNNGKIDTDEAIYFNYTSDEGQPCYDNEIALGKLNKDQIIYGKYQTPAIINTPIVEVEAPKYVTANQDWTVKVTNNNLDSSILSAQLNIYADDKLIKTANLMYQNEILQVSLNLSDLASYTTLSYNVVITDGINQATSTMATVKIIEDTIIDKSKVPALVISEIMPDSSNVAGSDAYEFIEIYNNSNLDINLKDYQLVYNYPEQGIDGDVIWWQTNQDKIIKSHDTLVFWIKNGANDDLTINDFNQKFACQLDSQHLISINTAGMANSSLRGLKIVSNIKDIVDYVVYNDNGVDDTTADKAIVYQNIYDDNNFKSVIIDNSSEPTPGKITNKPMYEATLPEMVATPTYHDNTPLKFNEANDLTFSLDAISNESTIKTVSLYIKDNKSQDFEIYNLSRDNGDTFTKTLPAIDLFNKQSYSYYFVIRDGYHEVTTPLKTVVNEKENITGDNLNLSDGQIITQNQQIIGTGDNLLVDNLDLTSKAVKSIGGNAKIVFDTTQTDVFFKNCVAINNDVIGIFNEGTYSQWQTYGYDINASYFDSDTKTITVAFHAGNKANALEHNIENNDDFVLKNIRLTLPDGTTLRAENYHAVYGIGAIEHTDDNWQPDNPVKLTNITPEQEISMGDGTSKIEILYATFKLKDENFNALRYDLDTKSLADGLHTITSGTKTVNVISDNTAPKIESNIMEGQIYHNGTIEASAYDEICGNSQIIATLDGKAIDLPYDFRSLEMKPGKHVLVLTAGDTVGNIGTKIINFETPEENASIAGELSPVSGTTVNGDPTFSLTVNDPTDDLMTVSFMQGERYLKGDANVIESSGVSQISGSNENSFTIDSKDGFPYQQFDVKVSDTINENAIIKVDWQGKSNNQKTFMYAYNYSSSKWDKLTSTVSNEGEIMTLTSEVSLKNHLLDSTVKIMVQNGEGYTPDQYEKDTKITTSNPDDTPRSNYDFTFAIESDTQYYNEDFDGNPDQSVDGDYQYQLDIHEWLIANRQRMNIQYLFHNGDIIDDEHQTQEWINANNAYKLLDDANLPYGVLAGNHDVGHLNGDYTSFSKYFGESRYNQNPWYGESYENNRGHYDLITVDGIDFIMLYMGWGIEDEQIQWMNEVLAKYPERKAILNFHEYLLASGGLGEEPQRIYDEVVAKNSNVCMVLSGHYHNAKTVVNEFDDDHDGINDRKVYQMLFDYQGLAQGGMGYMRLMHFDNTSKQIIIRTYSPTLDDYNAKDESGIGDVANINGEEEFVISYDDLNIVPKQKQIETTNIDINIYSDKVIGSLDNVKSNQKIEYTWQNAPHGTVGWYVQITDEHQGLTRSNVSYLNIDKANIDPTIIIPSNNTVALNSSFDPLKDVRAYDSQGNDLTNQIVVLGRVDVNQAGKYELIYKVSDSFGNTTIIKRIVEVVSDNETSINPKPENTNNGTNNINQDLNNPATGDYVNSNYLVLALISIISILLMMKKSLLKLIKK